MGKRTLTPSVVAGQPATYEICIFNRSGAPQTISFATDSFPQQWSYLSCSSSDPGNIQCTSDGQPNGGTVSWGPSGGGQYILADGADLALTVTGSYSAAGSWCNAPANYTLNLAGGGTLKGTDTACVVVN